MRSPRPSAARREELAGQTIAEICRNVQRRHQAHSVVDLNSDKLAVLVNRIESIWATEPPPQTLLGVARLAMPGMLVEVDAIATRSSSN